MTKPKRSAQGGLLQPLDVAEEESSATSVSEPVDYSKLVPFEVENWPDE
jgi:hypothetical protein